MGRRSLKVIENGTIRKPGGGFLFAFYSKYGAILYCLRDITIYWSKIAKFYTPPVKRPRKGWPRRNFAKMYDNHKPRVIGLQCGEETMTICEAVSIEYRNVTDGQTVLLYQCHASGLTSSSAVARCRACFVSLNTLLSHSRSLGMTLVSRACVSPY